MNLKITILSCLLMIIIGGLFLIYAFLFGFQNGTYGSIIKNQEFNPSSPKIYTWKSTQNIPADTYIDISNTEKTEYIQIEHLREITEDNIKQYPKWLNDKDIKSLKKEYLNNYLELKVSFPKKHINSVNVTAPNIVLHNQKLNLAQTFICLRSDRFLQFCTNSNTPLAQFRLENKNNTRYQIIYIFHKPKLGFTDSVVNFFGPPNYQDGIETMSIEIDNESLKFKGHIDTNIYWAMIKAHGFHI